MAADERQLIRRATGGDETAFRTLMKRYHRKVFAIAYGMVRDSEAAMDITQEVFIKVYRYLGSFQGSSSFYTWLYRISVNLSIDFLRKHTRRETVNYDDMILRREPDDTEAMVIPTRLDDNPQRVLRRKELGRQIARAFESLSEKHRAVIVLREIEGLSYEEIAKTLRIQKGTVMSRLHHARKNLQLALEPFLTEQEDGTGSTRDEAVTYKNQGTNPNCRESRT